MLKLTMAALMALHGYAGPVWPTTTALDLSDEPVTITVPATPPPLTEYGWTGEYAFDGTFTQVGWGWVPELVPYPRLFTYTVNTTTDPTGEHGTVLWGPRVSPGGSVTVRIVNTSTGWADQVLVGTKWTTLHVAPPAADPYWMVLLETYGPWDGPVCFSGLVSGKTCWG